MRTIPLLFYPLAAFLIGLSAVRAIRPIAVSLKFVDKPDRHRKLQETPIALGGGIAVWLATWLGSGLRLFENSSPTEASTSSYWFQAGLAITSFLILVIGVFDDRNGMRGRHKLAGQVIVATILVFFGLRIDNLSGFGFELSLGSFAYPVTVLWILLIINAFNLIDGLDGFCGSLGLICALATAFLSYLSGRIDDSILGLALAGALIGFLVDNLPPAKIYLGDAGSMTIGLIISALSIRACSNRPSSAVFFSPLLALLTLPILDVLTALVRRWLTGRSIFTTDRGHLHHRLRSRVGSTKGALAVAVGLATLGAAGATLSKAFGMRDGVACLVIVTSIGLLVGTNTFAASELRLLIYRIQTVIAPLLTLGTRRGNGVRRECHLHGRRDWARVWDALLREGEAAGVWRIELAIDITAEGEVYHGFWSLPTMPQDRPSWSIVHTLHAGGVPAGLLRVEGNVDASRHRYLDSVENLVRVVESQLESECPFPATSVVYPLPSVHVSVPLS